MEEILASIRRIIADDQGLPTRGGPFGGGPIGGGPISDSASTVESSHELLRMPVPQRPAAPPLAESPPLPAVAEAPKPSEPPPPSAVADGPAAATHGGAGLAAHGSIAAPQYPSPQYPSSDGQFADVGVTPIAREPSVPAAPATSPEPAPPAAAERFDAPPSHRDSSLPPPFEQDDEMFDEPIDPQPAMDPTPLFSAATDAAVSSAFSMLAASRLADNSEELMTLAKEMIRPMLRAWLDDNLPSMVERMVRAEIERVARGGR